MSSRPFLLALTLTLLGASVALAGPTPGAGPNGRFAELDRNRDGAIDRSEAAATPRLAERFERIDRNRDGRIVPDELRDHLKAEREARRASRAG